MNEKLSYTFKKVKELYKLNKDFIRNNLRRYKNTFESESKDYFNISKELYNNYSPCFVLSTGRCGTKFLTKILQVSDKLSVHHTPKPAYSYYMNYAYQNNRQHFQTLQEVVRSSRFELMLDIFLQGKTYVETNNCITFFAPQLSSLFPNAKFIHLVRHPGDFVRSGIRRNWYSSGNEFTLGKLVNEKDSNWGFYTDIEKISWLWNETNNFIEKFRKKIEKNRFLFIRSEDMFHDEQTIKKIFQFLNLVLPTKKKLMRLSSRPINKQISGNFPKYIDWEEEQKEQLKKHVTLHRKYNYSL